MLFLFLFVFLVDAEQNEKMLKKNKVIELYTKGERCVRKLSQMTGVPLTTVYRVIGKLKGINYNIPRGNGAGRKTILDAQDREILVEILNAQPRISRKALGKELEQRTGKSIHNSTLNRELCRLRHHGHNFAATVAAAAAAAAAAHTGNNSCSLDATLDQIKSSDDPNHQAELNAKVALPLAPPPPSHNYMKYFSNRKSSSAALASSEAANSSSNSSSGGKDNLQASATMRPSGVNKSSAKKEANTGDLSKMVGSILCRNRIESNFM